MALRTPPKASKAYETYNAVLVPAPPAHNKHHRGVYRLLDSCVAFLGNQKQNYGALRTTTDSWSHKDPQDTFKGL